MGWDHACAVHIEGMADRPNRADLERARETLHSTVCRLPRACQSNLDNFLAHADSQDQLKLVQPRADDNY
jgi:hypothetical protein